MRRREFLIAATAGASLAACASDKRTAFSANAAAVASTVGALLPAAGTGSLSAVIEYDGQVYRYDELNGTDLGPYTDPQNRFVQNSIVTTNEHLPLTVSFRRDRNSDRIEVVFELGRLWSPAAPANLIGYDVTIMWGDKAVYRTNVPQHFWFSRWRWQSAPRPVSGKIDSLIKSGLLPHYDARATFGSAQGVKPQSYQIMQLAGISRYMPETGERDDIGPLTESQAQFICTGSNVALQTLLAQAEAAGTIPWHFRDERTGAPIDVVRYGNATLASPQAGKPFIAGTTTSITADTAHQPAIAYVPFLLTGDPYHLETMQFQATYNIVTWDPGFRYRTHQVRGHAWSLRTLGQVAQVTPDDTPRWMLGRSYFHGLLNKQRDWMSQTFVAAPEPPRGIFRAIDESFGDRGDGDLQAHTYIAPWQEDFEAFILCWLVLMGHNDWEPIARWKIGSTIARTNGKSGWPRSHATPYYLILRRDQNSPWATSWGEAAALNAAAYAKDGSETDHLFAGGALAYPSYTRGVLAMAARLNFPEAKSCYEWINNELRRYATSKPLSYKWAIT
jgi:hypothetical protein